MLGKMEGKRLWRKTVCSSGLSLAKSHRLMERGATLTRTLSSHATVFRKVFVITALYYSISIIHHQS